MVALKGKPDWKMNDTSGIPLLVKLAFLKASHEDMSHHGGAKAIVVALQE